MPLFLTPPYLALLGALILFLGVGEDASPWILLGLSVLLLGLALLLRGALRRRWARRLRMDAVTIQAQVTGVASAPFEVKGATPHRLLCRGITPPGVGRTFRSDWIVNQSSAQASGVVTVLLDPRRMSRYLVDVQGSGAAGTLLQKTLRHLGALAMVLAVGFVELVVTVAGQPPAPLGPVHGEVRADGSRFGKGGLQWNPNLCRRAANPGATAVALIRKDDPYPEVWVIADPSSSVAAIDVQHAQGAETVRFLPSACTRLHGAVLGSSDDQASGLKGYVDAECHEYGADLTLHMDFAGCL